MTNVVHLFTACVSWNFTFTYAGVSHCRRSPVSYDGEICPLCRFWLGCKKCFKMKFQNCLNLTSLIIYLLPPYLNCFIHDHEDHETKRIENQTSPFLHYFHLYQQHLMLHLEHLLLCNDFYSGEQMSIIFVTKSVSWSINLIITKILQVSSCLNSSRVKRMWS